MSRKIKVLWFLLMFTLGGATYTVASGLEKPDSIRTCFTPGEQCQRQIIAEVDQAKKTIDVQAYHLTAKPIVAALLNAKNRGVYIRVMLDKTAVHEADALIDIPVIIDRKVRIAHNKVMIIDNHEVITGSYNFTESAETRNAENVLITNIATTVERYEGNFNKRWGLY